MRQPIGLHTHADVRGVEGVQILKVLASDEALRGEYDCRNVLVWEADLPGAAGSINGRSDRGVSIANVRDKRVIQPGDIVRLRQGSSLVSVVYRRGSKANTLFATERCNSRCVMCSQPPRDDDDSWRVAELEQTISLVDRNEIQLGITGGEPTLLGSDLGRLVDVTAHCLPDTTLHVLTNGRLFQHRLFASDIAARRPDHVVWAVPLYADVAQIHDEVVEAPGSFHETLDGLYELGRLGARVEIRVVLHKMTVGRLPQLASFIYRRLPFVEHVALMGLEPMGFAKRNRDRLWIDPVDYMPALESALFHLLNRGMTTSIYNLPLCVLPSHLWPFAEQSISDWKNLYPDECEGCAVVDRCAGFFASAGSAWRSRAVYPMKAEEVAV
ncbi:His-Xaa-Ser system radical SAM maturase HxsC [Mesorhizobium sp. YIM 152430]|uniref:His-Xaa-Ser system radical SAM maturase HxsC n=1 Tax=Mesorhizobium sp. YIM 152430 TaxID=3031761 RepID=UPI0023DAD7F7|nr:His-Xaa-Ser system radical SAM maturase HxsC [Mesorhizobium sp. YIM 152430]MDF1600205.1 His-Xaa-Ser system radical SAM maturase HxsC [Mesorhizobium sp. YIM 152430]